jgi:hypothetical protein
MKSLITLLLFLFAVANCDGQTFSVLQSSNAKDDSSYYDIKKIDAYNFWIGGEKGILMALNEQLQLSAVAYPNQGVNILCIEKFSDNHVVLCADKGIIYHYYKNENRWQVQRIKGFANKVFYKFVAVSDKVAYLCGGNSKIAASHKAIPNGFILRTIDAGKTWQTVYKAIGSMIWDLDRVDSNIVALKYNLRGTRLLTFNENSGQLIYHSIQYKMLAHEYNPVLKILSGANDFHIFQQGKMQSVEKNETTINTASLIWDVAKIGNKIVGASCNGRLVIFDKLATLQTLEVQSPSHFNLYGITSINQYSALIIGSNKTILKLDFGIQNNKLNDSTSNNY